MRPTIAIKSPPPIAPPMICAKNDSTLLASTAPPLTIMLSTSPPSPPPRIPAIELPSPPRLCCLNIAPTALPPIAPATRARMTFTSDPLIVRLLCPLLRSRGRLHVEGGHDFGRLVLGGRRFADRVREVAGFVRLGGLRPRLIHGGQIALRRLDLGAVEP